MELFARFRVKVASKMELQDRRVRIHDDFKEIYIIFFYLNYEFAFFEHSYQSSRYLYKICIIIIKTLFCLLLV